MYGKVFKSMYDGTLVENWQALITFQQMIVLCDQDGTVDMTPGAISRRTGIPLEHIEAGIEILENEDPYSRTSDQGGRRIALLEEHRKWGWYIINYHKYRNLKDPDEVREKNRERKRRQRQREAGMDDTVEHSCAYCGAPATGPDHVIPKSKGGTDDPSNIVPCCPKCNQHKAHRTVAEFIADPFVDWIDLNLIVSNEILRRHVDVTAVTGVTKSSQRSRHIDIDIDIDKTLPTEVASPSEKPIKDQIWELGPQVLGNARADRSYLGKAIKDHGEGSVLHALLETQKQGTGDPKAYMQGILKSNAPVSSDGFGAFDD